MSQHTDMRDIIFAHVLESRITAAVTAENAGILAGMKQAAEKCTSLGLEILYQAVDGARVEKGEKVLVVRGNPKQVAVAKEFLVGMLAKPSGIATMVAKALHLVQGRLSVVSGAWKKMPPDIKFLVREAITLGGGQFRIVNGPFLYLDKNFVRILGGIVPTLEAVKELQEMQKVIQLKGETGNIAAEAEIAVLHGADVLMVDTGKLEDARLVSAKLQALGKRDYVKLAFAGGIKIEDLPQLCLEDIDIVDIGAQVVDAPLLDFRFDVIQVGGAEPAQDSLELNLLEKTELWVEDITLYGANLTGLAETVADCLSLRKTDVLVVDVRETHITFDILCRTVKAEAIAGKEQELLAKLAALPGVTLGEQAGIHSAGILGMIALDAQEAAEAFSRSLQMASEIKARVAKRVLVYPSGFEVKRGMIVDTNSPMIVEAFIQQGYTAVVGPILDDELDAIATALYRGAEEGYGWIITTGGVGAEDKDHTVEAVLRIDPQAVTPWIVKFSKGTGRHVKEGVRIAVGQIGVTTIVSLPGPNDEVKVALDILLASIKEGTNVYSLAEKIASALRAVLAQKGLAGGSEHHHHHHHPPQNHHQGTLTGHTDTESGRERKS